MGLMKQPKPLSRPFFNSFEDWYREFPPARIIVRNIKTGEQIEEPSLVAVKLQAVDSTGNDPETGEAVTVRRMGIKKYLAVGRAAREYEGAADTVVFSPLRDGQIAHFDAAVYLFKSLLKQLYTGLHLLKPMVCIRAQERMTQVEERAILEAGVQAGARKVFLYQEPLAVLVRLAPEQRELRRGIVIDIDPQAV